LTNFNTVNKRIQRLKELEVMDFTDAPKAGLTKKELLILRREKDKLVKVLGGIRNMAKVPSALWVVDTNKEHLAITEARKLGIPVIAILDTNCDPDDVTIGIPGNDDAIRAIEILTRVIADAAADGMIARHSKEDQTAEPLADWERELLESTPVVAETVATEAAPVSATPAVSEVAAEVVVETEVAETPAAAEAPVVAETPAVVEAPVVAETPAEEAQTEKDA
jgi:small subunit ribosomal protein S2